MGATIKAMKAKTHSELEACWEKVPNLRGKCGMQWRTTGAQTAASNAANLNVAGCANGNAHWSNTRGDENWARLICECLGRDSIFVSFAFAAGNQALPANCITGGLGNAVGDGTLFEDMLDDSADIAGFNSWIKATASSQKGFLKSTFVSWGSSVPRATLTSQTCEGRNSTSLNREHG